MDLEQTLCDWLIGALAAGPDGDHRRCVPEVPPDLVSPTGMPCHVVERVGGGTILAGLSDARIDIHTYATGTDPWIARAATLARAADVHRVIVLRLPNQRIGGPGGYFVSRIRVDTEPIIRPYDSRNQIRRAHAAYTLRLHRPL